MSDGTGLAEALLGLPRFRVLEVDESADEVVVVVETTAELVGCERCGTRAVALRPRHAQLRALPPPRPAPHRWSHLAEPPEPAAHQNPGFLLKRVEPHYVRPFCGASGAAEVRQVVEKLGGLVGLLDVSEPKLRSRFYEEIGFTGTYDPDTRSVEALADIGVRKVRVGGGT